MKQNAPLFPIALCLMMGIALCHLLPHWTMGVAVLAPAVVVVCLLHKMPKCQTIGICCCVVLLGMTFGARDMTTAARQKPTTPTAQRYPTTMTGLEAAVSTKANHLRHQLLQQYHEWGISDEAFGVIAAMTLGDKSQIDRRLKDTYSKVGAAHVLALSGLHLMIIYSVISLFIGWRRIRMLSQTVIILAIWAFAVLVGMSPSVVRSAFMISIYGLLSIGYRERMSVNTLAFTAIVMLIIHPSSLYLIGFQLSFMAVLAILLFNPLFQILVPPHLLQRHRILRLVWGMTTVSLSAQIGTAPLVAYYFGRFSTWFLLSNYIVVPMATIVLWLTVACIALCWWAAALHLLTAALSAAVVSMNQLLQRVSLIPYNSIEGIRLTVAQVVMIYVVIASAYVMLSLRFAAVQRNV